MTPKPSFNVVQGDDTVERQFWTVSGTARFINISPEQVRDAMRAAGASFAMSIDDIGFLDDQGVVKIIQHVRMPSFLASQLKDATPESIDAALRHGSWQALFEDGQIDADDLAGLEGAI